MCQQVFIEVTFPCAFVLTLIAAERLFSGMNKHMLFQITSCCERGGTHGASVAFLSLLLYFGLGCKRHFATFGETAVVNKIFLYFCHFLLYMRLMRIKIRISAYADHPHEPNGSATAWPSLVSSQSSHLRSHFIIHTREKPSECNQCKLCK